MGKEIIIPYCAHAIPINMDSAVLNGHESLKYLDVAGHCLSVVSFQHQLHAAQSVHRLGEAAVLLVLHISLEVQMTPETECAEVLVEHLLSVWVQHGDVNISYL